MFDVNPVLVAARARRARLVLMAVTATTIVAECWAIISSLLDSLHAVRTEAAGWLLWACEPVSAFAVTMALFQLLAMASMLARSGRLTSATTRRLRTFAYWLFVSAAATSLLPVALLSIARLVGAGGGLEAVVAGSDFLLLLVSVALLPIAGLLEAAGRAQLELEQIV